MDNQNLLEEYEEKYFDLFRIQLEKECALSELDLQIVKKGKFNNEIQSRKVTGLNEQN